MEHHLFSRDFDEDVRSTRAFRRHSVLDIPPGTKERQLAEVVAYLHGDQSACATIGLLSIARHTVTHRIESSITARLNTLEHSMQLQASEIHAVRVDVNAIGQCVNELKEMISQLRTAASPKERLLDDLIEKLGGPLTQEDVDPETMALIFAPDDE